MINKYIIVPQQWKNRFDKAVNRQKAAGIHVAQTRDGRYVVPESVFDDFPDAFNKTNLNKIEVVEIDDSEFETPEEMIAKLK